MRDDLRLLSRPIPVHWAGWESTTLRLQQCGWEIAVHEDLERFRFMRFAFRHEAMGLYGYCDKYDLGAHPMEFTNPHSRYEAPPIVVNGFVPRIEVFRIQEMGTVDFRQIDAQPTLVENKIESLEDMSIFSACQHRTKEVLVEQADMEVVDYLERILEQQAEKQRELRDKARKRERLDDQHEGELLMQVVKVV